ncbi:MAG: hypothetical protein JWP55_4943 [Mycobacterium sp.]|nr:hypothetical protein [Mycobacterium sp.]
MTKKSKIAVACGAALVLVLALVVSSRSGPASTNGLKPQSRRA